MAHGVEGLNQNFGTTASTPDNIFFEQKKYCLGVLKDADIQKWVGFC